MCLAVPVRIVELEGHLGRVELGGVLRDISLALTPEAKLGDYVLIHTGFAITVLDEEEAQETLRLFAEMEEIWDQEDADEASGAGTSADVSDGAGAAAGAGE